MQGQRSAYSGIGTPAQMLWQREILLHHSARISGRTRHGLMLLLPCRYDRSLWPATQQVVVPATDLSKLRARLAALLSECGDLTSCQA
jgi:hypothetical protein